MFKVKFISGALKKHRFNVYAFFNLQVFILGTTVCDIPYL